MIEGIQRTVSIPVMAKVRIGHFVEARVLEALGVDFIDESEVLTPADEEHHVDKHDFRSPFVCGARNLGEALRRIGEGAAMIRTKGEAGSGNIVEAVRHLRAVIGEIRALAALRARGARRRARRSSARRSSWCASSRAHGRLPVPNFAAGGIATPADAALCMALGAEAVFVGSGIFKSDDPAARARAIVRATTHWEEPERGARGVARPRRRRCPASRWRRSPSTSGSRTAAGRQETAEPAMYVPDPSPSASSRCCTAGSRAHPFALLVTARERRAPFATHLPLCSTRSAGRTGTLSATWRARTRTGAAFDGGTRALAVFSGPHAYVSPRWYEREPSVPTWNYVAVHAERRAAPPRGSRGRCASCSRACTDDPRAGRRRRGRRRGRQRPSRRAARAASSPSSCRSSGSTGKAKLSQNKTAARSRRRDRGDSRGRRPARARGRGAPARAGGPRVTATPAARRDPRHPGRRRGARAGARARSAPRRCPCCARQTSTGLDALILPGGESTTIAKGIERLALWEPLRAFARGGRPVLGTCAGAILLAKQVENSPVPTLGLLDVVAVRNAYGTQVDSFAAEVDAGATPGLAGLRCVFIRAPQLRPTAPAVEVLARVDGRPVLVREGNVLAATFHPELTDDPRVHALLLRS